MQWNRASPFEFEGKLLETETNTYTFQWRQYSNGGKAIVEQILAPEERKKLKRAEMWEPQLEIQVGKLTIWVKVIWDRKIIAEFTKSISSTRLG